MAVMRRYLLPPMLNTIKSPTLSAVGKVVRTVSKLAKSCRCMILNHRTSALSLSGCCSQNWRNVLREITCMQQGYLTMRWPATCNDTEKMLTPNASLQLLSEAGAQRTLEAVSCKALLGLLGAL